MTVSCAVKILQKTIPICAYTLGRLWIVKKITPFSEANDFYLQ